MIHVNDVSGTPAQFLIDNIALLPKGRALDIAMGAGRNAIYLAKMGFNVEGIDISEKAIIAARQCAQRAGVIVKAQIIDLQRSPQIQEEAYDVIICFNYLQRSLIPHMKNGLRCGGMVVYETYIIDQAQFGKPTNPDYLFRYNELLNIFREFRCLRYREGVFEGPRAIASIIAEKVTRKIV